MAAPGVSKATGAEYVCELLGIASERVHRVRRRRERHRDARLGRATAWPSAEGFEPLTLHADWVCPPLAEDGVPRVLEAIALPHG